MQRTEGNSTQFNAAVPSWSDSEECMLGHVHGFSSILGGKTSKSGAVKRKRVVLTIETKLKIIERLQKGESVSKLATEFNVGGQTVRDIFRKKDELLKFMSSSFSPTTSRKTIKGSTFEQLDNAMYEWFKQKCLEGHPMSAPVLIEKAQWFHKQLKIQEPFTASQGWLHRFRSRHGIQLHHIQREKLNGGSDTVNLYRTEDMEQWMASNNNQPGHEVKLNAGSVAANSYHTEDLEQWMASTATHNQPELEVKEDDTIAAESLVSVDLVEGSGGEESDSGGNLTSVKTISLEKALNSSETLLAYLEQEDDTSFCDVLNVRKIRMSIKMKMSNKTRQLLITDFFTKK